MPQRDQQPWTIPVKATPFHRAASEWSLTNSWTQWGEYTLADVYSRVEEEYDAIRRHIGVCDLSPTIKYRVSGQDAQAYLDRLLTRDIRHLKIDRALFSPFCDDDGCVIDFAMVHRLEQNNFTMLTTFRHLPWFLDSAAGFAQVTIDDITDEIAIMSLHGMASCGALLLAGVRGVDELELNASSNFLLKDTQVRITRTRGLGELSYELWIKPEDATLVWQRVLRSARQLDIRPAGLSAREICRLEAGHLIPGRDFVSADAARFRRHARTPFELGLDGCVDLAKGHFVGRRSLADKKAGDLRCKVVGLSVEGMTPVNGFRVFVGDRVVGSVTSSAWSPLLKQVIAFASLDPQHAEIAHELEVEVLEHHDLEPKLSRLSAIVVSRPFYASPARNARINPDETI